MSANLMWKPVIQNGKSLPDGLKYVLRDKRGFRENEIWGKEQLSYLGGLLDAGIEGAAELIAAIEKHERVELWLEY